MKIIWNHSSSPKNESKDTSSKIALPKRNGQWIDDSETDTETFFSANENLESGPSQIHVPEATKRRLQLLSIQEINLYEQEQETIMDTKVLESTKEELTATSNNESIEVTDVLSIVNENQKRAEDTYSKEMNTIESTEVHSVVRDKQYTSKDESIEGIEVTEVLSSNDDITIAKESTIEETCPDQTIVLPSVLMEIEDTDGIKPINTISANNPRFTAHQGELRQMAIFCISIFTMALIPYTSPAFADYRPWNANETPPLIGLWTQQHKMTEDASGSIVVVDEDIVEIDESDLVLLEDALEENVQEEQTLSAINDIAVVIPKEDTLEPLEPRSPARPEKLHVPTGSLDAYFTQLSLIEDGTDKVARALVWGDSTIASDGIIKDVRGRMQERFGDAGPGFLAAKVDKRWAFRRDIVRKTEGNWSAKNIVHGGATDSRYGLAGTVSIAHPGAKSKLAGVKIEGERQDLHRFQVFYQRAPGGGDLLVSTQSKHKTLSTKSENISDAYYEMIVPSGNSHVYLEAQNANVVIYGVALEVDAPGVTWETFGVAGSSISSMQKQHDAHLSSQIAARDPSLLVYWTGGNELGYPSLKSSTGKSYKKYYRKVVRNLKDGAPQASCLLIGPLDQAKRENGQIVSKPTLDKLIRFQREVAEEEGCAYWDARAAMGGQNAFKEWLSYTPALASPDLAHLTGRGRKRIGDTLADVLIREYDLWRIDNPEIFWNPEESIADPTGDLWEWECDNPEPSGYELLMNELEKEDVCKL